MVFHSLLGVWGNATGIGNSYTSMGFFYYTWALVRKALLVVSWRHFPATIFRALFLPIVYVSSCES